jgi:hypothetical protein
MIVCKKESIPGLMLCFILLFSCGGKSSSGTARGKLAKTIIGTWQFDTETFKTDPEIRIEIEKNPNMETVFTMFETMQLIITNTTMTSEMTVLGQTQSKVNKYKVVSESGNVIITENTEAGGGRSRITIVDDNHIKMIQDAAKSGPPLVFKRIH